MKRPLRRTPEIINETTHIINPSSSISDHSDPILSPSDHISNTLINEKNNSTGRNETNIEQMNPGTTSTSTKNTYKRKKTPLNVSKKFLKNSLDRNTDSSTPLSIILNSDPIDLNNHDEHTSQQYQQPSSVWLYATRSDDKSYAICNLCNKRVSTSNWSTSALRRHLIQVHKKKDLFESTTGKKKHNHTMGKSQKEKLHKLSIESIIKDGLPFNTFNKKGLRKLLQEVAPGTANCSIIIFFY